MRSVGADRKQDCIAPGADADVTTNLDGAGGAVRVETMKSVGKPQPIAGTIIEYDDRRQLATQADDLGILGDDRRVPAPAGCPAAF